MTDFVLRPYQNESVDRAINFMKTAPAGKNGLVMLPTGSGKSLVIANIVKQLDAPCLIFQPSKEILEQNEGKLRSYGIRPAIYSASMGRAQVGEVTLATIGSVRKQSDRFQDMKYLLIDECHLVNAKSGMYKAFFESLPEVRILGLSATPYRLTTDGYGGSILKFLTRTRPRIFSDVVHYVQNRELFDAGYLAPLEYRSVNGLDLARLQQNSTGADFTDRSVRMLFDDIGFDGMLQDEVQRLLDSGRKNVLVFTRFVEESEALAARIPGAAVVTAETKKAERVRILRDFRAGRIPVVSNVGVLTVGFDYPELETVVLARPTMSLALYYQMVGRCVRPHPDKEKAVVVDMVGNLKQFGKVEDLELKKNRSKWFIASNGRPLTNVYFGQPDKKKSFFRKGNQKRFGGRKAAAVRTANPRLPFPC